MQYLIGILLLLSFFALAFYCIKGYNLMIGFLIITIVWTVLPLVGTLFVSGDFLDANEVLKFGASHPLSDGTTKSLVDILNGIYL